MGKPLECVSMNNQESKVRPEVVNVNSNEPVFYPFSIKTSKFSGSCNNINDPYAILYIPYVVKNINVKVFNLMWRTNETRHIKWHETCKCKRRLDVSVCNSEKCGNKDKCRCECKELIDKGVCDKGFIGNPSNCECESNKMFNIGEYLDYENCKCRKKLFDKLVEECTENIVEVKLAKIAEDKCKSLCTVCVALIAIVFNICIGIGSYFVYSHWYLQNDDTRVMFDTHTETTIYWTNKWDKLKK